MGMAIPLKKHLQTMKKLTTLAIAMLALGATSWAQGVSKTWVADQGDGTYKTPFSMPTTLTPTLSVWATTIG